MCHHEKKYCPHCNTIFECKVGSINLCQCTAVLLSEAERNYIRERFDDCLCVSCMKDLKAEYHKSRLTHKIIELLGLLDPRIHTSKMKSK